MNKGQFLKGKRHVQWKGGRVKTVSGYIWIHCPNHPRSNHGYVYEHRLVMEKYLGRYLKNSEIVHHVNHVRNDNRIENLTVLSKHKHHAIHIKIERKNGFPNRIRGMKHYSSKLSDKDVRKIRNFYSRKEYTGPELSKIFKVTHSQIYKIINIKNWKHIK